MSKSRKFFVTYWTPKDLLWDEKSMKYACKCDDHCSDEHGGKWHGHYYVYYKNPRTWNDIKKYYGYDCHVEIPKCNSAAIKYILGQGDHAESKSNIVEMGTMPCDNGCHITVREALQLKQDDIKDLDVRSALSIMKIQDRFDEGIEIDDWKKDVKITFITGPSGVGKTEKVKQIIRDEAKDNGTKAHIIKYESTFYHGVGNGRGIAIYDDFRDSHMKASEFINLIDYNVQKMNVKGGTVDNNFKRIFITSVQRPEEIYRNMTSEPRMQWMRRIEVINMWPSDENFEDDELL